MNPMMIHAIASRLVQVVGTLLPVYGIFALLKKKDHGESMIFLLMADIACLFMNVCYLLMMDAVDVSAAFSNLRMQYISNALFYFFFTLFVLKYLKLRIHPVPFIIWGLVELIGTTMLMTSRFAGAMFHDFRIETGSSTSINYMTATMGVFTLVRNNAICLLTILLIMMTAFQCIRSSVKSVRQSYIKLLIAESVVSATLIFQMAIKWSYDPAPILGSIAIMYIIKSVAKGEFYNIAEESRKWALAQSKNVIITVDTRYKYIDANDEAKKLFPLIQKCRLYSYVPDFVRELFDTEEAVVCIDGKYYDRQVSEMRHDSEVMGHCLVLRDITDRQLLLEEVEYQRDKANAAVEARSAFMSNMSHEIRTPMNAIVGMTDIILRTDLTSEQKGYLYNIKNSGKALLSLVNDILDFSKIDAGKMEIVNQDYEPMSMFNDIRMILLNRIGDKPIELKFDIDSELPAKLYGDNLRVRQILINLGNNATKFTDSGTITITTEVRSVVDDDIELYFAVTDTGMGIKEEDLGRLFAAFAQVDTTKNHSKEGTGLGLSISKQLAELMGGSIGVSSVYGEGSTFYFTIHQKVRSEEKAGSIDDAYTIIQEEVIDFEAPDAQILLVDDNEMNIKVALGLLEPIHMQIETASNGKEALEMISSNRNYDLVLMDHMMPIMDGCEATQKLRALNDDYCKNVPVLALTANVIASARNEFASAGMNDFISKPIEMKEICAKLKKWLPEGRVRLLSDAEIAAVNEKEEEELPVIEGLNVAAGVAASGSKDLFISLLGDFYKLMDMKSQKIQKCLADDMIRDYTVEVHALKNTARMIGALELSEEFYELEQAGNAGDKALLLAKTPGVLEHLNGYKTVLEPYAAQGEGKQADAPELISIISRIRDCMDCFDTDGSDAAMKELEDYSIPSNCMALMNELRAYVADLAMEDVIATCDKMIEALNS